MDNQEILRKQLDAFVKGDWNTYKSLLTDNAIYDEEATRRLVRGPDQVVKTVQIWKKAFPDLKATIKSMVATGDAVVAEIEWEGTQTGPLDAPTGQIPPSGKHGKVMAVQVARFDNGKIRELRHYFDLMTVLMQLGVAPRPSAPTTP